MNGPLGPTEYLGDGLYASTDGYLVALTADLKTGQERTVYLEPDVVTALFRYVKDGRS